MTFGWLKLFNRGAQVEQPAISVYLDGSFIRFGISPKNKMQETASQDLAEFILNQIKIDHCVWGSYSGRDLYYNPADAAFFRRYMSGAISEQEAKDKGYLKTRQEWLERIKHIVQEWGAPKGYVLKETEVIVQPKVVKDAPSLNQA